MAKSLLLISRQSPWSGPCAREALDILLAGGAFDLPVSLLLLDDGVFQLVAGQQAKAVQQKDLGANLQALPLFGIEPLYVCNHSLTTRGLAGTDPIMPIKLLDNTGITTLIHQHQHVITI